MKDADPIDTQILNALRLNGRLSHARLGEEVRLSRNAVRQRIERMERDGLIRGYTIVEAEEHPSDGVTAVLLVNRNDRMRGADVISTLRAIPEVLRCDVVTGELDLVVQVRAARPQRVREIWQSLSDHPGVNDITTAMSLSTLIDRSASAAPPPMRTSS